ncbi:DUF4913 domain-containing protein [Nocardia flavorosea]|uniref:DUF4913 domain-containing protein n=1 Tax=Nocardia flavorosea TaxID=53429 RepID=UPI00245783A0|nr:DUF4913 domain-containing protein [Nocardia flavorosea]
MTDIDNTTYDPDFEPAPEDVAPDFDPNEFVEDDDSHEYELGTEEVPAGAEPQEAGDESPAEAADLTDALTAAISKAVAVQIAEAAKEAADGVISEALTDDVVVGMRETAVREAQAAIDPDLVVEEPAPEPPELRYRTLPMFVEIYVANVYRREVSERGSEKTLRWCPYWWDHGEAVARLEALWTAFEALRQGPGAEMAAWWVQYADPLMAAVLDPEGPFKYCSVQDGHKPEMPALPTVTPPEGLFEDGHAYDPEQQPATGPLTSPRLILPSTPTGNRRVVIPEPSFP